MHSVFRAIAALVPFATGALAGEVRTTLSLSGLTCTECAAAVTKALNQVAGVREVEVSADRQSAVVIADDRVAPEALAGAVRQLGYRAEVVQP
jgi:copper chaperone CopZ